MRSGPGKRGNPAHRLGGTDADILGALSRAARTLREAGLAAEAREMQERVLRCGGTEDALLVMGEYVRTEAVEGPGADQTERRDCA
ncbi:MAG: hypothetical protein IJT94_01190 [Oscillibacter sp.]|nr:hypothetical protein [Oscillibacter sp.]